MNSAPREPRQFHEISRSVKMLFECSTAHSAAAARCPPLLCAMSSDTSDGSARRRCEPECTLVVSAAATPAGDVGSTPRERSSAMTSKASAASARAWRKAMGARHVPYDRRLPYDAARATRRARATGTCDTSAQHTTQHEPRRNDGTGLRYGVSRRCGIAGPRPGGSSAGRLRPTTAHAKHSFARAAERLPWAASARVRCSAEAFSRLESARSCAIAMRSAAYVGTAAEVDRRQQPRNGPVAERAVPQHQLAQRPQRDRRRHGRRSCRAARASRPLSCVGMLRACGRQGHEERSHGLLAELVVRELRTCRQRRRRRLADRCASHAKDAACRVPRAFSRRVSALRSAE